MPQKYNARHCLVEGLRRQLGRWEAAPPEEAAVFSSGATAIDRLLPGGGLRHGMLVEWLAEQPGGAAALSLLSAREACREGGVLVVVDRRQMFYPPAAAAWGVDLRRLIIVHPRDRRDELWAAVQSLRSPAVAAVWAMIERLDDRAFRRLQLAAQAGRTLGLLLRPASVRGQPSWADVQLGVEPRDCKLKIENLQLSICNPPSVFRLPFLSHSRRVACSRGAQRSVSMSTTHMPTLREGMSPARRVQVRVLRLRGGRAGRAAMLEIDDAAHVVREVILNHDAHPVPVAAQLADPTAHSRPARAQ